MSSVYTSRVWDCWDAMYDALSAAPWTAHPSTSLVPPVQFSGNRNVCQEMITLPGMRPPEGPGQAYATMGVVGRNEMFTLVIEAWSEVPGYVDTTRDGDPSRAVRNRLREFSDIIEATFRDQTTGRPTGVNILNVWKYEITANHPSVAPLEGQGGYGGALVVEVTFTARI